MSKMPRITAKELLVQDALGSLPEEYRIALCRYITPAVSKGNRTCNICGLKCIHKGEEYYLIDLGQSAYHNRTTINVCKPCSWLSMQTINRITDDYNATH
jgi:hypothetical protein